MPDQCQICLTGPSEWNADDLEGHIRAAHGDNEAAVAAMYGDEFDHLFEEGGGNGGTTTTGGSSRRTERQTPEPTGGGGGATDSVGKKWFMIGVGGAGNNILDALLMRRDTLVAAGEERARIWEGGLGGYGLLNTNTAELEQTYYAQEEQGYSRAQLESNTIIGLGAHDNSGMGYRWQNGAAVANVDFEGDNNPFRDRWDMRQTDLRSAQALLLVHSVTKGTGCGSTPVLAERIREEVLSDDRVVDKAILSAVVIPSVGSQQSTLGGRGKTNGVVGLARTAQAVDAVMPFNNAKLREVSQDITPRVDGLAQYNPPQFVDLNKPLVAFLEAFTMSSTPQFVDENATMSIRGNVFDVADSFRLVQDKYPANMPEDERPAVVLAPVLGRLRSETVSESKLEILARRTLDQNRFADFDPSTAWGGNFMLYGPEEKMREASAYVTDGRLQKILNGPDFLDAGNTAGIETVDVQLNQLVTPQLDDLYMWGMLWNPEMPALEAMYEHAQRLNQEGQTQQAESVREVWGDVEALFSCLGRENML